MSPGCLEGAATVAPTLPFELTRPTDGALFADVAILLAVIAALYFGFKAISQHPWIPTSISLAVIFYAVVDREWWNTARVVVDEVGVRYVPWVSWFLPRGDEVALGWGDIAGFRCEGGALFPLISDDARIVLHGRAADPAGGDISIIEIPRYLEHFPEIARVVADKVRPLATP